VASDPKATKVTIQEARPVMPHRKLRDLEVGQAFVWQAGGRAGSDGELVVGWKIDETRALTGAHHGDQLDSMMRIEALGADRDVFLPEAIVIRWARARGRP